jgi:uncharacterized protein (DUF433 family)
MHETLMATPIKAGPIPLAMDADGVLRVGGTRVTLDTVVGAFQDGATPEEIVVQYPALALADVYAVISYYLQNRADVEAYLHERQAFAAEVRKQNEARFDSQGIRERLLVRYTDHDYVMLRLLADENFNNNIIRGLLRREPKLDIIRVQDTTFSGADDPIVLEWAAQEDRILLTHDVSTITHYAYERVRRGQPMPGIFEVNRGVSVGQAIEDILLLATCSLDGEWEGQVYYLPL